MMMIMTNESIQNEKQQEEERFQKAWAEREEQKKQEKAFEVQKELEKTRQRCLRNSSIDLRHEGKTFEDLSIHKGWRKKYEEAKEIINAGGMIVFVGDRGSGKTQCAVELIKKYCHELKPCLYIRARGVGIKLRQAYDKASGISEIEAVEYFTRPWLLAVDEIQEGLGTDFEAKNFNYIVDTRYANMQPTIFIANILPNEVPTALGPSIYDRMREGGKVLIFKGDFRVKRNQDDENSKTPPAAIGEI